MRFTYQNLFLWIWCKSFQNLVSLFCFILIRHMLWDLLQLFYSKFKFYALIFLSQYFNISFNIPFYLLLYFVWVPEKRSCVTIPLWWGWHTFWCTRQRDRHGSIIIIINIHHHHFDYRHHHQHHHQHQINIISCHTFCGTRQKDRRGSIFINIIITIILIIINIIIITPSTTSD